MLFYIYYDITPLLLTPCLLYAFIVAEDVAYADDAAAIRPLRFSITYALMATIITPPLPDDVTSLLLPLRHAVAAPGRHTT